MFHADGNLAVVGAGVGAEQATAAGLPAAGQFNFDTTRPAMDPMDQVRSSHQTLHQSDLRFRVYVFGAVKLEIAGCELLCCHRSIQSKVCKQPV